MKRKLIKRNKAKWARLLKVALDNDMSLQDVVLIGVAVRDSKALSRMMKRFGTVMHPELAEFVGTSDWHFVPYTVTTNYRKLPVIAGYYQMNTEEYKALIGE